MDQFATLTGRAYHLFDYSGHPEAERVAVAMGSGAETLSQTALYLAQKGEKVGVLTVRLFRPFSGAAFLAALPKTVRQIAVLDRSKEPGSLGEPLYQDVVTALAEGGIPARVSGGVSRDRAHVPHASTGLRKGQIGPARGRENALQCPGGSVRVPGPVPGPWRARLL